MKDEDRNYFSLFSKLCVSTWVQEEIVRTVAPLYSSQ